MLRHCEPAIGNDDGGAEGGQAVNRLILHLLQQRHPPILFLPHLTVVVMKTMTSNSNHHLVKMKEDNEVVLGVKLDKAYLLAEVLDHHPRLSLLRLTCQRVGPKLFHPCLEEEVPAQAVLKNHFMPQV